MDKKPNRQRNLADNNNIRKTIGPRQNVERIRWLESKINLICLYNYT